MDVAAAQLEKIDQRYGEEFDRTARKAVADRLRALGPDGQIAPVLLAAAKIAGVDTVYRVGGAQAIAGLAYGTDSIGRVDKILGPGNIFVALAKQQVFGAVAIDGLAGPTECLLVADETANPTFLAADLIAQAEHDPLAQPLLFCTSREVIERTLGEAERMIEEAPRASIIRESLAGRGGVVRVPDVETGIALSIVVFGAAVAFGVQAPVAAIAALAGLFAIFHGHAHGAEMPADAGGLGYGLGFMLATALLHASGIGLGFVLGRIAAEQGGLLVRAAGGAAALAGFAILAGVL